MAFSMSPQENEDEDVGAMAEINIVPLVDVMLVLLIIFMVAAPLSISGIAVKLPQSRSKGEPVSEEKLVLSIDKLGNFFFDKTPIADANLSSFLKDVFEQKKTKQLFIRADREVVYGRVVDAMSRAKIAGAEKLGMLTRPTVLREKKIQAVNSNDKKTL